MLSPSLLERKEGKLFDRIKYDIDKNLTFLFNWIYKDLIFILTLTKRRIFDAILRGQIAFAVDPWTYLMFV